MALTFAPELTMSRSPYGERGLKFKKNGEAVKIYVKSLSLRRAWIEIQMIGVGLSLAISRSPYGERGLKSEGRGTGLVQSRRSPYGECGLKWQHRHRRRSRMVSLSLRRAWIEISWQAVSAARHGKSLSLRRAWIEMERRQVHENQTVVALLTESVD